MEHSNRQETSGKEAKPRKDFPLFAHQTNRWAKKVRGKLHYFGKILPDDPKGEQALRKWLYQKDDLLAGRSPRDKRDKDALTIDEGVNLFLDAKKLKLDNGEIVPSTWLGYKMCCRRIKKFFGANRVIEDLRPADFQAYLRDLSKTNGLIGRANQIRACRMVFRYLWENEHIPAQVKFGSEFKQPDRKLVRKHRKPRMYEAHDIRRMLDAAGPVMKAMILLGINCGFGNADVGRLQRSAIDEKTGWVTFPRPKTGSNRRIKLWPETLAALQEARDARPTPARDEVTDHVFLTAGGEPFHKDGSSYLSEQFRWFLRKIDDTAGKDATRLGTDAPAKLHRAGIGFYVFRHVFETIAGESRDQVAVDAVMGHERSDMASVYRERVSDGRLEHAVNVVRTWLWLDEQQKQEERSNEHDGEALRIVG